MCVYRSFEKPLNEDRIETPDDGQEDNGAAEPESEVLWLHLNIHSSCALYLSYDGFLLVLCEGRLDTPVAEFLERNSERVNGRETQIVVFVDAYELPHERYILGR